MRKGLGHPPRTRRTGKTNPFPNICVSLELNMHESVPQRQCSSSFSFQWWTPEAYKRNKKTKTNKKTPTSVFDLYFIGYPWHSTAKRLPQTSTLHSLIVLSRLVVRVSNSLSRCRCWWRWRAVWASSATCEGPCWPSRAHAFPPEQRAWCSASGAPTSSTWPRCQRWYSPRRRACAMPASAWRRTMTAGRSTKRRLVTYLFCLKKKKKRLYLRKLGNKLSHCLEFPS